MLDNKLCGITCFCDKMPKKPVAEEEIIYFEDEELDAYKGLAPNSYTDQQVAEFDEVLTTMRPEEVPEWLHSLQLRGIKLPQKLYAKCSKLNVNCKTE